MQITVRSQDRENLITTNSFSYEEEWDHKDEEGVIDETVEHAIVGHIDGYEFMLGCYVDRDRAISVLDMLHSRMNRMATPVRMAFDSFDDEVVFQMPAE